MLYAVSKTKGCIYVYAVILTHVRISPYAVFLTHVRISLYAVILMKIRIWVLVLRPRARYRGRPGMTAESNVLCICRLPDENQDLGFVFKANSEIPGQARYDSRAMFCVYAVFLTHVRISLYAVILMKIRIWVLVLRPRARYRGKPGMTAEGRCLSLS
ncbi:hypothetical protein CBP31_12250 [Oceanisphaera profunda]|uniref:Uncharacterized protein n=1 Tax=Oceanisphaera profunda TaxID=1416627 RepID=A0A1Y0D7M6_9GAMM|nr:hypothetical protein [Oceanisphaera profunda]ART83294.1 hypothetical protein CBP31_12250 [Oceanisphaera profunda]